MKIKIGFEIAFDALQPTPMVILLNVHPSRQGDLLTSDQITTSPLVPIRPYHDSFGNECGRLFLPAGRTVLNEVRRQKGRYALRGSAITRAWDRLDRASATLTGLAGRLTGPGEASLLEAAVSEQWLRDLGQRVASVERAIPLCPAGERRAALEESHASLAGQFTEGVTTFEQLVAAAASYVAEDGHPLTDDGHPALSSLIDATDRLRGLAEGLSELKRPPATSI